jgi:hypothetical protein
MSLAGVSTAFGGKDDGYQLVSRNGEFALYRKKSAGDADLLAFRGIGVLPATPIEVATGILDRQHRPEWMRDVRNLRTVRVLGPGHFIEYSGVKTPFIVKDRDFVIRSDVEVDLPKSRILILSRSVTDAAAPETSAVRGEMTLGRFLIEPGPIAGTARLTADMDVDPKGSVPHWIVNRFQKNWPVGMFYGLKNFLARRVETLPEDLRPLFAATAKDSSGNATSSASSTRMRAVKCF